MIMFFSNILNGEKSSKDSFQIYKEISILLQIGINEALNNNLDVCYKSFDEAYQEALKQGLNDLLPIIAISHSRLYLIENNYDEAFRAIRKAKPYIDIQPQSILASDYYELMAQCYMDQKKFDLALNNLKLAEVIRAKYEPGKNWRTYTGMANIYRELNNDKVAQKYREKASKLSKIQNSRRTMLDLQNELKFDEQSGTIELLNTINFKTRTELEKSKFRNILLLTMLLAFVIISVLLIYILRQRSLHAKEMSIKNDVISKNLIEKEDLIMEIHHRVKNNLQVISSLLSLQSRTVDDKNASDALRQSQSRVMAMSLIHHNLYKNGPASQLDINEYLTNLCQQIFNSYNLVGDKLRLQTEIAYSLIDVNLLVPLGLIINELITNSLKYAFKDRASGNIIVTGHFMDNAIILKVQDDGIGDTAEPNITGFGTKLVETFAKKINAQIIKKFENGTLTTIIINQNKKGNGDS